MVASSVPGLPLGGVSVVVAMLATGAVALGGVSALAGPAQPAAQVLGSSRLSDDDGGKGLFALSAMVPGVGVSRCLRIGHEGRADGGEVRMAAESVSGALARSLNVTVDRGRTSGGGCAGFTGSRVFTGSLGDLAGGTATGWRPGNGDAQTFRITVVLDAAARPAGDATAQADFVWRLREELTPSPSPSVSHSAPAAAPAPAATAPATHVAKKEHGLLAKAREMLRPIVRLAKESTKHVAISVTLVAVMLLFLFLQGVADRRDPKFMLAPVTRSRYVWIPQETGR
jgi:hypothetical protein